MPLVEIVNGTPAPMVLRFAPLQAGGTDPGKSFEIAPGKAARIGSGYMYATRPILRAGGCDYAFAPLPDRDKAIDNGYGMVTTLRLTPDLRLYVMKRGELGMRAFRSQAVARQPSGWPLSPISRACR